MTRHHVEAARKFWAAIVAQDVDTVMGMLHPDIDVDQSAYLPYGGHYHSKGAFNDLLGRYAAAWTFEKFEMVDLFVSDDGENVVAKLHVIGTATGSGKPFNTTILEQWTFKDGKLTYAKPHWFEPPAR